MAALPLNVMPEASPVPELFAVRAFVVVPPPEPHALPVEPRTPDAHVAQPSVTPVCSKLPAFVMPERKALASVWNSTNREVWAAPFLRNTAVTESVVGVAEKFLPFNVVNVATLGVPPPIVPGAANVAPPNVAAFTFVSDAPLSAGRFPDNFVASIVAVPVVVNEVVSKTKQFEVPR